LPCGILLKTAFAKVDFLSLAEGQGNTRPKSCEAQPCGGSGVCVEAVLPISKINVKKGFPIKQPAARSAKRSALPKSKPPYKKADYGKHL
jgi:hypothetical protein